MYNLTFTCSYSIIHLAATLQSSEHITTDHPQQKFPPLICLKKISDGAFVASTACAQHEGAKPCRAPQKAKMGSTESPARDHVFMHVHNDQC